MDYRGIIVNTEPKYILGTGRHDEVRKQDYKVQEDKVYKELSAHFSLLIKSNTEAMESLFCDESAFLVLSPEYKMVREAKESLISSVNFFNSLRGYMQGEYNLAIGNRKGQIGGKRYAELQKYGFSPKNFTQLFRLFNMGRTFFLENRIVINVKNESYFEELMAIKTTPWKYTTEFLTAMYLEAEKSLERAYENRVVDREFDLELANDLILKIYLPILNAKKV